MSGTTTLDDDESPHVHNWELEHGADGDSHRGGAMTTRSTTLGMITHAVSRLRQRHDCFVGVRFGGR